MSSVKFINSSISGEMDDIRARTFVDKWFTLGTQVWPLQALLHDELHDAAILPLQFGTVLPVSAQIAWHTQKEIQSVVVNDLPDSSPRKAPIFLVRGGEYLAVFVVLECILEERGTFVALQLLWDIYVPEGGGRH